MTSSILILWFWVIMMFMLLNKKQPITVPDLFDSGHGY